MKLKTHIPCDNQIGRLCPFALYVLGVLVRNFRLSGADFRMAGRQRSTDFIPCDNSKGIVGPRIHRNIVSHICGWNGIVRNFPRIWCEASVELDCVA